MIADRLAAATAKTPPTREALAATDAFHRAYYDRQDDGWSETFWCGVQLLKCPMDILVQHEIIWRLKPDLLIETGSAFGGSALFYAHTMDLVGNGSVLSIDVQRRTSRPPHPRIGWLVGDSVAQRTIDTVRSIALGDPKVGELAAASVIVVLDSDHARDHVLAEMEAYAPLVTPGSFLIVEDTNVNGHPVLPEHGPGPMEAVDTFLARHDEFIVDRSCEKHMLTFCPNGYLRRVR